MHLLPRPAHAAIAVLAAAVIGLGTVVAVDHTTTSVPRAQPASLAAAPGIASSLLASGALAGSGQFREEAAHVFDFFITDTRLTWEQVGSDLLRGETLDQIAGTHAARVEADALNQVRAGLAHGVVKGAITPAQETRLVNDAKDAISVLMAAKLSALLPAGR